MILYNSEVLYIRMFIILITGLYPSRVLINTLNAFNYIIYNVLDGFVSIVVFFNAIIIGRNTVELEDRNQDSVNLLFSTSFFIHAAMPVLLEDTRKLQWTFSHKR